jgi:hypothetical protein
MGMFFTVDFTFVNPTNKVPTQQAPKDTCKTISKATKNKKEFCPMGFPNAMEKLLNNFLFADRNGQKARR